MKSLTFIPLVAALWPVGAIASVSENERFGSVSVPEELAPENDDENEIVVTAASMRGEVQSAQPPVLVLDEEEIASYGVDSISDLLSAISPQTGSGRGRSSGPPAILLNGQRISSFRELRSLPPEAIRRLQVLPEEVGLRYGFRPDQRVVNFILKDKFSSRTAAGEYNLPTRGGYDNWELEGGLLQIDSGTRMNFDAKIVQTTMLTEDERNIQRDPDTYPTVSTDPEPTRFRSLEPWNREISLNGTSNKALGKDGLNGSFTLNGAYTRTDTRSLSGVDSVILTAPDGAQALRRIDDPLETRVGADAFETGLAYNRAISGWQFTGTLDAGYTDSTTTIDKRADTSGLVDAAESGALSITGPLPALAPAGEDKARSKDLTASSLATIQGRPFWMPAGDAALTVMAGFDYDHSNNTDTRSTTGAVRLERSDLSAGANLVLPLTSRRENVLGAIGDLTLNVSGAVNELSDFGTLTDWSAGLTWSPTGKLSFNASYIVDEEAPTLAQLGNPTTVTYNVPVYDYTRGESVLVSIVGGGNPDLLAEKRSDIKLSANWELPFFQRSNLLVEYFRNRSNDVTQAFPLLTPSIEAAFPDRVTRDVTGQLVAIDRRPVTFDEIESSSMRWGFNVSGSLGQSAEQSGQQRSGGGGPAGGGRPEGAGAGGPPGGGMPGLGRGGRGSRWNLSVYHTWRFVDQVTVASGGPVLDQLDGDAIAAGGVPRHSVELEGGMFKNGYGLRLKGEWNAPATVNGSGAQGSSDLRFGSTFALGLRLFMNLGQQASLVEKVPFLKSTRVAFTVDNLLDQRQKVTDENGNTPLAYQPAYREPQGRVIGIDLRKMF